jgi:DnaK suppressor protein
MPAKKPAARTAKAKKPAPRRPVAAGKPAVKRKAPPVVVARPKAAAAKAPAKPKPIAKPVEAAAPAPVKPEARPVAARPARPMEPPRMVRPFTPPPRPAPLPRPASADGEDEGYDGGQSLLAGPRNVQPYLPKKGEQYMNAEQLEHFRQILLAWKQDLMEEVDRTVTHMKDEAANPPDPNDRATLESEFSLELRTRDRERKLIRKIDEALMRIEDGSYGYCLETGEEIGIKRLEARPVATLSLEAQERRERREKQYGDRDDRYR